MREENEALRAAGRRREDGLLAEISVLKEDKLALESAIRAASLSSDFAEVFSLGWLK